MSVDDVYADSQDNQKDEKYAGSIGNVDEYALMRAASASGQPIWPDDDDLIFLFSARYNGEAFRNSYLQAEYRAKTHTVFSGMVDYFIDCRLKSLSANPTLYNQYVNNQQELIATSSQSEIVLKKARLFGIDISKLDVGMLVYDVEKSLQNMVVNLMPDHPDFPPVYCQFAQRFMDNQLWNGREQILWRYVTAEKIASLYAYDAISTCIPLIRGLDTMIHYEFTSGEMKGQNPSVVYFGHLLSDDIVDDCLNAMDDHRYDGIPADWMISDIISDVQQPEDDW